MATTPTSIAAGTPRGITNTLSNFVVESETFTNADVSEQVPDQMGAIVDEIAYDIRIDLRLTVRSAKTASATTTPPAAIGTVLTYASIKYKVDSVEEAGTYNGLRRWNISAHRYTNYPA